MTTATRPCINTLFDTFGITELQVIDIVGEGYELNAYGPNSEIILLPQEESVLDDTDTNSYITESVLNCLYSLLGEYKSAEGTLTRDSIPQVTFTGNVTRAICVTSMN